MSSSSEVSEVGDDDIDNSDDEFDDWITLGESSPFRAVKWEFPDTDRCPLDGCNLSFSNRLFALAHFCSNHSSTAMLCEMCNIPFPSADISNLEQHYELCHPDASLPTMKTDFDIDDFLEENFFDDVNDMNNWNGDDASASASASANANDDLGEGNEWIQLNGCGKNSCWKFPSCLTKCPECATEFDSRTDIIAHYKEKHAADVILCYICDCPILGTNFQTHFRLLHPNDVNPFNFDNDPKESPSTESSEPQALEFQPQGDASPPQTQESPSQAENSEQQTEEHAITEAYDELVELSGCNIKTLWRFSDIKHCPVHKCRGNFADRMEAKRHYIEAHARDAILCSWCSRPIVSPQPTYYTNHFKRKHPQKKVPFNLYKRLQMEDDDENDDEDDDDDDEDNPDDGSIKLKGCGITTYWQLPETLNRCPSHICRMVFENNAALKQHYKQHHAKHSILCEPCGWPLVSKGPKSFQLHFQKTHPNMTCSYNFRKAKRGRKSHEKRVPATTSKTNDDLVELNGCNIKTFWSFPKHMVKCPVNYCCEEFAGYTDTREHYRSVHAANAYYCDECKKPFMASNMGRLKRHFMNKHANRQPSNIFDVSLTSTTPPSSDENHENKQQKKNVNSEADVDDLIVLGKKCNQVNYWRFPARMTRCPSPRCSLDFGVRSAAINHFRKWHADSYIFCSFCVKPIYAPTITKLKRHFKQVDEIVYKAPYKS